MQISCVRPQVQLRQAPARQNPMVRHASPETVRFGYGGEGWGEGMRGVFAALIVVGALAGTGIHWGITHFGVKPETSAQKVERLEKELNELKPKVQTQSETDAQKFERLQKELNELKAKQ